MTATGLITGCFIQIGACVLGISVLLQQNASVFQFVRSLGALYLIYLGAKALLSLLRRSQTVLANLGTGGELTSKSGYWEGLLCNLLNPKFTLFLLSVFTQFTGPDTGWVERLIYGATLWLQAVAYWYLFAWLLQGQPVQKAVTRFGRVVDPVLGVLLAALGIRILIAG